MNHRGVVAAMSEGINQARGQWIARMDSDDIALPDKFAVQLAWAKDNGLDVCGAQAEKFGKTNGKLCFPVKHEAICSELFFRCAILYAAVIIRSSVLLENPSPASCAFDDYELFTRLAPRYRLGNVPLVLLSYRQHENQSTKVMKKEFNRDFRKYRFRYFHKMFPNTPLADYLPLTLISDRQPLTNLRALARAGQWLVGLADIPDENIRRWMGKRWQKACRRSAKPGEECDVIFQHYRFISGNESDIDDVEIP